MSEIITALLAARARVVELAPERGAKRVGPITINAFDLDELLTAAAIAMAENGLVVTITGVEHGFVEAGRTDKNGNAMVSLSVRVQYRIHHTSGEHLDVVSGGLAADCGQFSLSSAMSAAWRKWLETTFGLRGHDEDAFRARAEQPASAGPARVTTEDPTVAVRASLECIAGQLDDAGLDDKAAWLRGVLEKDVDVQSLRKIEAKARTVVESHRQPPAPQPTRSTPRTPASTPPDDAPSWSPTAQRPAPKKQASEPDPF